MIRVLVRVAAVLAVAPVELRRESRVVGPDGAVLRPPEADPAHREKLTVVVQGYSEHRKANYERIFQAYGGLGGVLDQVIFIWNNVHSEPPAVPQGTAVPIRAIRAAENLMTNRFNITQYLRTDALVVADDDLILSQGILECMRDAWRAEPERLIGLDERAVADDGGYRVGRFNGHYDIVLGRTMLFSAKRYLTGFFSDAALVEKSSGSCDDIGMNAYIAHASHRAPLIVRLDSDHRRDELQAQGALSTRGGWGGERTNCTKWMLQHFGPGAFQSESELRSCSAPAVVPAPAVADEPGQAAAVAAVAVLPLAFGVDPAPDPCRPGVLGVLARALPPRILALGSTAGAAAAGLAALPGGSLLVGLSPAPLDPALEQRLAREGQGRDFTQLSNWSATRFDGAGRACDAAPRDLLYLQSTPEDGTALAQLAALGPFNLVAGGCAPPGLLGSPWALLGCAAPPAGAAVGHVAGAPFATSLSAEALVPGLRSAQVPFELTFPDGTAASCCSSSPGSPPVVVRPVSANATVTTHLDRVPSSLLEAAAVVDAGRLQRLAARFVAPRWADYAAFVCVVLGETVAMLALGWYILSRSSEPQEKEEKAAPAAAPAAAESTGLGEELAAVAAAAVYMSFSIAMTLFNKWLYMPTGGNFDKVILLTVYHQVLATVLTRAVAATPRLRAELMPSVHAHGALAGLSRRELLGRIVPPAALLVTTLSFGNKAYLFLSVSFIQMIKAAMPVFVFALSCLAGLEDLVPARLLLVLVASAGMAAVTRGELKYDAVGFAFLCTSFLAEGVRMIVLKNFVSLPSLDALSALSLLAPVASALLMGPGLLLEWPTFDFRDAWRLRYVLLANGAVALGLNLTSLYFMRRATPTTYALVGMGKDALLIASSMWYFGDATSRVQMCGFAVAFGSTQLFLQHKKHGKLPWN